MDMPENLEFVAWRVTELQGDNYFEGLEPVRRQSHGSVVDACHRNGLCMSFFMPNILQRQSF
jgi:hypothetical protein